MGQTEVLPLTLECDVQTCSPGDEFVQGLGRRLKLSFDWLQTLVGLVHLMGTLLFILLKSIFLWFLFSLSRKTEDLHFVHMHVHTHENKFSFGVSQFQSSFF